MTLRRGFVPFVGMLGLLLAAGAWAESRPMLAGPEPDDAADMSGMSSMSDQTFSGRMRGNRGNVLVRIIDPLNLDADQADRANRLLADHGASVRMSRQAIRQAEAAVRQAREDGDPQALGEAGDALQRLRTESPQPLDLLPQLEAILTEPQADELYANVLQVSNPPFYGEVSRVAEALQRIDLDEEERQALDALIQAHRTACVVLIREHGPALQQARQAINAARRQRDEQALDAARKTFWSLVSTHDAARPMPTIKRMREHLSPEQLSQLDRRLNPRANQRGNDDPNALRDDQLHL